jgi:hypothetical protein
LVPLRSSSIGGMHQPRLQQVASGLHSNNVYVDCAALLPFNQRLLAMQGTGHL